MNSHFKKRLKCWIKSRNTLTQVKENLLNSLEPQEEVLLDWLTKVEELRSKWGEVSRSGQKPTKKLNAIEKVKIETALNDWFDTVTSRWQKLSGTILKEKAENLAKKLGNLAYLTQQAFSDEVHYLLDKWAYLVDNKCTATLK